MTAEDHSAAKDVQIFCLHSIHFLIAEDSSERYTPEIALISTSTFDQAAIICCTGQEGLSGGSAELQAGRVLPQEHVCQLWRHWVSRQGVSG